MTSSPAEVLERYAKKRARWRHRVQRGSTLCGGRGKRISRGAGFLPKPWRSGLPLKNGIVRPLQSCSVKFLARTWST